MNLLEKIRSLEGKSVLVIGDSMLDEYEYGTIRGMSPEAPVPVVEFKESRKVPGGAANTANNLASLSAKVELVGVCGKDLIGETLLSELRALGVGVDGIVIDSERPTTLKRRTMVAEQQVIRVDYESKAAINVAVYQKVKTKIQERLMDTDVVVVSDYGKGIISRSLMEFLIKDATEYWKPIVIDGKPQNLDCFYGVTLITPNMNEAREMIPNCNSVEVLGNELSKKIDANVFITHGDKGIYVFDKSKEMVHVSTKGVQVYDVTGAGDTVVAVSALGLASKLDLVDIAQIANLAGRIVVQKPGTATVSLEEIKTTYAFDKANE